jgi:hypothetical protein
MPDVKPCGTDAAYARHYRHGEPIDDACRAAHSARCKANYQARSNPVRDPTPREAAPCGTEAAARRHWRRGEPLDEACRQASRVAGAARKGQDAGTQAEDPRPVRNNLPWKPYRRGAPRPDWAVAAIYRAEAEHGTPPEDEEAAA